MTSTTIAAATTAGVSQPPPENHHSANAGCSFTAVQQRRLGGAPVASVQLCPSMDLVAIVQSTTTTTQSPSTTTATATEGTVHIHRTLNWQTIGVVATTTAKDTTTTATSATSPPMPPPCVAWRPDGRCLAVAQGTTLSVQSLEGLLRQDSTTTAAASSNNEAVSESLSNDTVVVHGTVAHVAWVHVGRPSHTNHRRRSTGTGADSAVSTLRQSLGDRSAWLPPTGYNHRNDNNGNDDSRPFQEEEEMKIRPTTPLSLLCVTTTTGRLSLWVHGRYRIAETGFEEDDHGKNKDKRESSPFHNGGGSSSSPPVTVVATSDLATILCVSNHHHHRAPPILKLWSLPDVSRHAADWQTLACRHATIHQHLTALRTSVGQIAASYKSSLKAMDTKLDSLAKLLTNYGLLDPPTAQDTTTTASSSSSNHHSRMRTLLVQYMLSGHTRTAPNLSNAMDQFCTGVSMNDQLMQRLQRSLTGAVANVETSVCRTLLAPARALVETVDGLAGWAEAVQHQPSSSSSQSLVTSTRALLVAARHVLWTAEVAHRALVQARGRLADWTAWWRSTASDIKARGTAAHSVQRENAQKRRVPQSVTERLLSYLQDSDHSDNINDSAAGGTTESVLSLGFAALLQPADPAHPPRSDSPLSVQNFYEVCHDGNGNTNNYSSSVKATIPSLLAQTLALADTVFDHPRSQLRQSMHTTDIHLSPSPPVRKSSTTDTNNNTTLVSLTTRLGQGGSRVDPSLTGEDTSRGFFAPTPCTTTTTPNTVDPQSFSQWTVVARVVTEENNSHPSRDYNDNNMVELYAIPLPWVTRDLDDMDDDALDDDDDESRCGVAARLQWGVRLRMSTLDHDADGSSSSSTPYRIRDVLLYGDDGKSSLSSGIDSGAGQEGRHGIGLLVSRSSSQTTTHGGIGGEADAAAADSAESSSVELWLIPYDDLEFGCAPLQASTATGATKEGLPKQILRCTSQSSMPVFDVKPRPAADPKDDNDDEFAYTSLTDRIVYAQTRELSTTVDFSSSSRPCRLELSGSRGMGAVWNNHHQGGTALEVFDLEEDEEDDDDDDEQETSMEAMEVEK